MFVTDTPTHLGNTTKILVVILQHSIAYLIKRTNNRIYHTMLSRVSLLLATTATVHAGSHGRALNAAETARSAAYRICYDNEFATGGVSL